MLTAEPDTADAVPPGADGGSPRSIRTSHEKGGSMTSRYRAPPTRVPIRTNHEGRGHPPRRPRPPDSLQGW
jgi:hypothetical protein